MIVYCCQDLIFATKIRATADAAGVPSRPTRNTKALRNRLDQIDDGKPNDPVTGVVIDLEMGEQSLELIELTKSHDPNIPVIAFGSHVATQTLQAAHDRGADFVMPRSQFTENLPSILDRFGGKTV